MNAVLGFTQLLLADDGTPDDSPGGTATRRARLEHIHSAGEHLLTLINNVLELSRLDGPAREVVLQPVLLAAVIGQSLPLVEGLAQQHGVTVAAPASPLYVRADATRLKQVLVNLLTNAIKYNRPGGNVRLDVSPEAGQVRIRVSDDGIGMTSEQQADAFEPFNRAGAERDGIEGTGIGLTIVKALVEGMGGRISVNSARGVGSEFEVWLDAAAESGPLALPARRLLYIEDNAVNVLIVSELVRRRAGIEFDSMPDGASGVARAAQTLPGLTLVDMQLPDIDGLEVLARLRANAQTAGLRVVALSANAIPADIQRALQAGFDDYWTKPLDFKVFNAALDQVFGSETAAAAPALPSA
jgi:CheY-like chemotaxis protein/anti-sigma regulatory factor (Ser/Thr protein kinase)